MVMATKIFLTATALARRAGCSRGAITNQLARGDLRPAALVDFGGAVMPIFLSATAETVLRGLRRPGRTATAIGRSPAEISLPAA